MSSKVFDVFTHAGPVNEVRLAEGIFLHLADGSKKMDLTAGDTSYAIVGWNHPDVNAAMRKQLKKFSHVDYKAWRDPNVIDLAEIIVSSAPEGLTRVYFSGNSGAEACEAAMRMSYQYFYDRGQPSKKWFISREQSYHGATADALSLGERPNLEFFRPTLSPFRSRIPMHHPLYLRRSDESDDEYAERSSRELEHEILRIGPDNVAGFVAETILGGLVGDVPPANNYWRQIRQICDKYDVHLILDEIYCGTSTSGKYFCCEYDQITPDMVLLGKTLAAGYGAISAVVTTEDIYDGIKQGQGRLQHTTTHQAHSLAVAAALEVQKIVSKKKLLAKVLRQGLHIQDTIRAELQNHDFFRDVRGRGLRQSFEYSSSNNVSLSEKLKNALFERGIYLSCKWHRASFTPSLLISDSELNTGLEIFISQFKRVSK